MNKPKKNLRPKIRFNIDVALKNKNTNVEYNTRFNKEKIMIYSKKAKQIIKENPTILKQVYEYLKKEPKLQTLKTIQISQHTTVKIGKIKRPSLNSYITDIFYALEINKAGKSEKYFIKKVWNDAFTFKNANGATEMKALEIIKSAGYNIIPAHFGWRGAYGESYIFYEFQSKLIDAEKAYEKGLINRLDLRRLKLKLEETQREVNTYISKANNKHNVSKNAKVLDIVPNKIKDEKALPLFIDMKNKKLFLFDPILYII